MAEMRYKPVKEGVYYSEKQGRVVEHHGYATSIFWSPAMIGYLRRNYPTTHNDELAECLGVSKRTMIRKARELGLEKDAGWLASVWEENRLIAQARSRRSPNSGRFKKGVRHNPDGEFKPGHTLSAEVEQKRVRNLKIWCRMNPDKMRVRSLKAWETRRKKMADA